MNILIKFLSKEAIENTVTCLNYKIDQVIFFAEEDTLREEKKNIKTFLSKYCNAESSFYLIKDREVNQLSSFINTKLNNTDNFYIDMTGSEGVFSCAVFNSAYKRNIPMHIYDIRKDIAINIDEEIEGSINDVPKRKIKLNIHNYIEMVGGIVRDHQNKDSKLKIDKDVITLFKKYSDYWTSFVGLIHRYRIADTLRIRCEDYTEFFKVTGSVLRYEKLREIAKEAQELKIIKDYTDYRGIINFSIADEKYLNSFEAAGTVFEQIVFQNENENADDCMVGVHLDWDGIITIPTEDVLNEIDVLKLDGYILTFISCKNTKKLSNNALYELESVARRFGGNYAEMKLCTTAKAGNAEINRANSVGIDIELLKF